jgi:hypothetical protein
MRPLFREGEHVIVEFGIGDPQLGKVIAVSDHCEESKLIGTDNVPCFLADITRAAARRARKIQGNRKTLPQARRVILWRGSLGLSLDGVGSPLSALRRQTALVRGEAVELFQIAS